jgi:hypothetical protein
MGIVYRTLGNKWPFEDFLPWYWRGTPGHDNRHLRLRYAEHGFAPALAALCPMVCGKPKTEAQNLGVDRIS